MFYKPELKTPKIIIIAQNTRAVIFKSVNRQM